MNPSPGFLRRQAVIGGLGRIPPGGPSPFGATLQLNYPRIAESPGTIHTVSSLSALNTAIANDSNGTIIRLDTSLNGGDGILQINRNATAAAPITITCAPGVTIQNFLQVNVRGSYLRLRGLQIFGASDCGIKLDTVGHDLEVDGCDIYSCGRQGILWAQTVSNIQIWNNFIHDNGSWVNQNLDHGMYTSWARGPCVIANNVVYYNSAYSMQIYPDAPGMLMVCNTLDDGQIHDPWSRGGLLIGSNTSLTDDTLNIGMITTNAPSWGISAYDPGGGDTNNQSHDCIAFGNGAGDYGSGGGLSYNNCSHADPGYLNRGGRDYRIPLGSPAQGKIQAARWGYVPPTDIRGNVRVTADAGAWAAGF